MIRKSLSTDPVYFGNNVLNEHAATVFKVEMFYEILRCIVGNIGTDVLEESTYYFHSMTSCNFGG